MIVGVVFMAGNLDLILTKTIRAVLKLCRLTGTFLSGNGGVMRGKAEIRKAETLKLVPVNFRLPVMSLVQAN